MADQVFKSMVERLDGIIDVLDRIALNISETSNKEQIMDEGIVNNKNQQVPDNVPEQKEQGDQGKIYVSHAEFKNAVSAIAKLSQSLVVIEKRIAALELKQNPAGEVPDEQKTENS